MKRFEIWEAIEGSEEEIFVEAWEREEDAEDALAIYRAINRYDVKKGLKHKAFWIYDILD